MQFNVCLSSPGDGSDMQQLVIRRQQQSHRLIANMSTSALRPELWTEPPPFEDHVDCLGEDR